MRTFCFNNDCIKAHNQKTIQQKKSKAKAKINDEDIRFQTQKTVKLCNQYIRLRDKDLPCISCNHDFKNGRQMHAGHFRPAGNNSKLRFNVFNIHGQCSICNNHLSGNVGEYERNLREKIGDARVDALLSENEPYRYTIEELKGLQKMFKKMIKELV